MTRILTLIAAIIIAMVAIPFYLASVIVSKIGLLIMISAKALVDFGMKLIAEQRERDRAANLDSNI